MAVVWITGASSGIGEALAKRYAAKGDQLVLSARRKEELERVQRACMGQGVNEADVLVLPMDVTDFGAMAGLAKEVADKFGRIDVLINNAGVGQRSPCLETDLDVYEKVLTINTLGPIALTKAVLPIMLKQGSGHIAAVSSVTGKVGVKNRSAYATSKHAVMGFFDSLRTEVEDKGIKVTTIVPGYIQTDLARHAFSTEETAANIEKVIAGGMDADKCADVIVRRLSNGDKEIAVGEGREMMILPIKRFLPGLAFRLVASENQD